jgi:hypothetical protein
MYRDPYKDCTIKKSKLNPLTPCSSWDEIAGRIAVLKENLCIISELAHFVDERTIQYRSQGVESVLPEELPQKYIDIPICKTIQELIDIAIRIKEKLSYINDTL